MKIDYTVLYKMYRIKYAPYKVWVDCEREDCGRDHPNKSCNKCGGKGYHRKTKWKWRLVKRKEDVYNVDITSDGVVRFWTSYDTYCHDASKLLHFSKKGAELECWKRNKGDYIGLKELFESKPL